MLFAADEAIRLIDAYEPPVWPLVESSPDGGVGFGWSEAPRGCSGTATRSAPTGGSSERRSSRRPRRTRPRSRTTCAASSQANLDLPDDELQRRCEQAVRNYDPCISCSTHFLRLEIDRRTGGVDGRVLVIGLGNRIRGDDGAGGPAGCRAGR